MIAMSRQVRRACQRAAEKEQHRPNRKAPAFGDRRLNRRKRFALWALQRRLKATGELFAGRQDEVATAVRARGLAERYRLPPEIVAEQLVAGGRQAARAHAA